MKKIQYILLFIFIGLSSIMTSQEYGQGVPGADLYSGQCRIDYVNAYRDGKACAEGNRSFCGIDQPTNSPECRNAQREGYATGYESGNREGQNISECIYDKSKCPKKPWEQQK